MNHIRTMSFAQTLELNGKIRTVVFLDVTHERDEDTVSKLTDALRNLYGEGDPKCPHDKWAWAFDKPKTEVVCTSDKSKGFEEMRRYCAKCGKTLPKDYELEHQHRPWNVCGSPECQQCAS